MPSYAPPLCFSCPHFKKGPQFIGDKASCAKYAKIPDGIFFQSGDCAYYTKKSASKPKTKVNKKKKK